MVAGRQREMGLGPYPQVSIAEARELAAHARKLRVSGTDPIEYRDAQRAAEQLEAAHAITFQECARSYIEAHRPGWKNPKHAAQWVATLNTYAMPVFGNLRVQDVDVALVMKVLEPIWPYKTETASRLRGRIETILDWARARGYRQGENPARWKGHLDVLLPRKSAVHKVKHFPALPNQEIGSFMAALRKREGVGTLALQFLILTAARTKSVRFARWSQIDFTSQTWNAPAGIMKGDRPHRCPLSEQALAILSALNNQEGDGYLFRGLKPGKPISDGTMDNLCKNIRLGITVHGFRSTFKDWASECTAFPNEVSEAALAHIVGDKVEAAYRRGDLFEKRRKLMKAWGDYCTKPSDVSKVVPIRRAVAE